MNESASTPPGRTHSANPDDLLRHLPAAASVAFQRFKTQGDVDVLDPVVFAIVADFMPGKSGQPLADRPIDTRLIEDLGFDSLAITELVFFTEELFGITIANDEIVQVRTIGDLRAFVRRKVSDRAVAA